MKLHYRLTLEDVVAFNRYHFAHSPLMKRNRMLGILVHIMVLLMVGIIGSILLQEALILIPALILLALSVFLHVPRQIRHFDKQVRKFYQEGSNKSLLGDKELELTETTLIETTTFGETRKNLYAIEKVVATDEYAFIYVSAVGAHIIPRAAVSKGDFDAFLATLQDRVLAVKVELGVANGEDRPPHG